MLPAVFAVLAAAAIGARAAYPRLLERRERLRLPVGPDGVVPGAAAIHLARERAPGVLLIHGCGDTPQVLEGLATYLYDRGFSVRVPLLAGHGADLTELANTNASAWRRQVRREYDAMKAAHSWVAMVGLSMGGALAVSLSAERGDVPTLVLLAPYLAMPAGVRGMAATHAAWGWLLPYFSSGSGDSIRDPEAAKRVVGRGILTPAALRGLYDVMLEAAQALPRVTAPVLIVQSRQDNRISSVSAEEAFTRLGSREKKLVWIEGAGHVITVDYGYERVFELTAAWLETRWASRSV